MLLCNQIAQHLRNSSLWHRKSVIQFIFRGIKDIPHIVEKRVITQAEVDQFAKLTGDTNYIHSAECPSDKRCVHGAYLNAIVAGIIGTKLPGPGSIVVQQEFTFPQKCVTDEEILITVQILDDRHIKKIAYNCRQKGLPVFTGTAKIIVKKTE